MPSAFQKPSEQPIQILPQVDPNVPSLSTKLSIADLQPEKAEIEDTGK